MLQKMAWAYGGLFVAVGILGFVSAIAPGSMLFGAFAVGTFNNIAYLIAGAFGLVAARSSQKHSLLYFKLFGIVFAIATVAGFIQGNSVLGLMTVNAADNFFHLIVAAVALWAGFGSAQQMQGPHNGVAA